MSLLENEAEPENLLPEGGSVYYYGSVLSEEKADIYFKLLLEKVPWKNDEVFIFGKKITTKRQTAWFGDQPFEYTYSRTTKTALPWIPELLELKQHVEEYTGLEFNSCLLNLYHSGEEGMSWHSDDEKPLGPHPNIAALSLGAERKFSLKHKVTRETLSLMLERGSLLVMREDTQENWMHSLPKSKKIRSPRISLTFRYMFNM